MSSITAEVISQANQNEVKLDTPINFNLSKNQIGNKILLLFYNNI